MELSNYQAFMECMRKWEKIGCNILCGRAAFRGGGGSTSLKAAISALLKLDIVQILPSQMMCLAARMEASSSQVSLPAPSSILPAPFWGGVKLLKMLVGEPFRPMVVASIRG